jgi:hypothetical protein
MTQIILEIGQPVVIEKLRSLAQKYQRTLEEQIVLILENSVAPFPKEQTTVSALDNTQDGFWDMTLRFRQKMQQENILFADEDFAGLRDRSLGREVENWFVKIEDGKF